MNCPWEDQLHLPAKVHPLWKKIQYHREREPLGILHAFEKFHHYCFARGNYNYGSQTTAINLQERHSNTIPETPMYMSNNSLIQNKDTIQAWTRPMQSRLVVMTKPWREEGQRNTLQEDKHWHVTYSNRHSRMYFIVKHTAGITYKINTCNGWNKTSYEAGQQAEMNFCRSWDHTGHSRMIWWA